MKFQMIALAVSLSAVNCLAQTGNLSDWPKLLDKNDVKAAQALCTSFAGSKDIAQQVEAQKCLANVALCGNSETLIEGDDAGGGNLRDSYKPEAVDEALVHLNLGLKLAPQDLSIHMGRLHVLEVSGRYAEMAKALDESSSIYNGKDAIEAWLAYAPELMDLRQYDAGVDFMRVMDKHYPNNPDILGNIGAFLSLLKKNSEALPYLQKAVDLAPNDPINSWDLGRLYDYMGQNDLADQWYKKGIALESDPERLKVSSCIYAKFVANKLNDVSLGCSLEKKSCAPDERKACMPAEKKK